MITLLQYLFPHDLNIAEPKICEILLSTPQTQFTVALRSYLLTTKFKYFLTQNNNDQHNIV